MAHFAEIGLDNAVLRVIVVNNAELLDGEGVEQEALGADFAATCLGAHGCRPATTETYAKTLQGKALPTTLPVTHLYRPSRFQAGHWTKQRANGKPRYLTPKMGRRIRGMKPAAHGLW